MDQQQQQSQLKQLITKGKEQGYLTYTEVNDHLPEGIVEPEQIEDIVRMINDMGIEVHETAPAELDSTLSDTAVSDDEAAEACLAAVAPLRDCFKYGNPNTVVKTAVILLGYPVGTCRAPFNYQPDEGLEALRATLESDRKRGVR